MSLAGTRVNLTHLCTIRRDASVGTHDTLNQQAAPDWQDHITDQECRGYTVSAREAIRADSTIVLQELKLMLPIDTDVTQHDQIGDVTNRGALVLEGPMRIDSFTRYPDRLELSLTSIA